MAQSRSILSSSAVMAAGTVVSRLSGFVRSALLAAALGAALHADQFTIANTIPNMLYILLAGGVFNAVLVPQLVRSMKNDADGGEAYTNRIVTLAALFLGAVTVLLVVLAPWVMGLFIDASYDDPALSEQRQSLVDLARYCLPQVFFYGMFVLVGQILNSRGSFGPMMWAPIANNVISIGVLVVYLFVFGPAKDVNGAYSTNQELLLGIGSTVGIAAQLLILLPYLAKAGFRYRPRFDFRGTGLGHTFRLAVWTVLFVVVNQVAYTVVVRLASSGTAGGDGTGYTVYSSVFLIVMVPHAVVTVSLATAVLPTLSRHAADADHRALAAALSSTMRTALVLIVPFVLLLPLIATDVANVVWGYGAVGRDFDAYAPALALFAIGLFFFTLHYFALRGFYALEETRTVFLIQCWVALTNILLAVVLVNTTDADFTAPALVLAYGGAYAVGAAISLAVLGRRLGGLDGAGFVRFLVRTLIAAAIAAAAARGAWELVALLVGDEPGKLGALVQLAACGGVDLVVFLGFARLMRVTEVTELVAVIGRRLPVARRG